MKPTHKANTIKRSTNTQKENTKQSEQTQYDSSKIIIIINVFFSPMDIYGSGGKTPLILELSI